MSKKPVDIIEVRDEIYMVHADGYKTFVCKCPYIQEDQGKQLKMSKIVQALKKYYQIDPYGPKYKPKTLIKLGLFRVILFTDYINKFRLGVEVVVYPNKNNYLQIKFMKWCIDISRYKWRIL